MSGRPNILVVMTDQQRWDSLGCNGNSFVETPVVDELAAAGARFTRAFTVWPICTPARATAWLGVYPHAHDVIDNIYGLDDAIEAVSRVKTTVFHLLKQAGYRTAYFGKWHLGEANPGPIDVWDAFNSLGGHWVDGRQSVQGGTYMPDAQTDRAVAFLHEHARTASDVPFFLVQSYYPPHQPYTAPIDLVERYTRRGVPFAGYYAHNTALDLDLGRMRKALRDTGTADRTLVIYLSDHGETFRYRDGATHKVVCNEEAIRIPLIMNFPGRISPGTAIDRPVGMQDVMPTILDYAGVPAPPYLHGTSMRPLVEGRDQGWREAFYVQNRHVRHYRQSYVDGKPRWDLSGPWDQRSIRTEEWKLILSRDGPHSLYDLRNDPQEMLDLYGTPKSDVHDQYRQFSNHDDVVQMMAAMLRQQAGAIDDPLGIALADEVTGQR